jgi:hypothetical protein
VSRPIAHDGIVVALTRTAHKVRLDGSEVIIDCITNG